MQVPEELYMLSRKGSIYQRLSRADSPSAVLVPSEQLSTNQVSTRLAGNHASKKHCNSEVLSNM